MSDTYNTSTGSTAPKSDYEAVLFDFDGVLLATGNNDWRQLVEEAAVNALYGQQLTPAHGDYDRLKNALTDNDVDVFEAVSRSYGMDADATWEAKAWHDVLKQQEQLTNRERSFYEDVRTVPDLADSRGVGVVSNNNQEFVDYAVTDAPIADQQTAEPLGNYLDVCYGIDAAIADVANRKPDPAYLLRAADDLDVAPENVLYIGDRENDIVAADAAGMASAFIWREHHFNENGNPLYTLEHEPDHHLDGLDDLADMLRTDVRS